MNIDLTRNFLMWCSIINYGILILWYAWFSLGHDSLKKFSEAVVRRKMDYFDTLHLAAMAVYKAGVVLFNIVPWIALTIIR